MSPARVSRRKFAAYTTTVIGVLLFGLDRIADLRLPHPGKFGDRGAVVHRRDLGRPDGLRQGAYGLARGRVFNYFQHPLDSQDIAFF